MPEPEFKLLSELRVTELKQELEKRSLDKNGIKVILTDRLEKAIRAEGHDPASYKFCVSDSAATPTKQKSAASTPAPDATEEAAIEEIPKENSVEVNTETKASESEEGQAEKQVKIELKDSSEEKPESMDTSDAKNTSAEEEQLDDPLDDKTESPKVAAASVKDDKDTSARSFWVRGLSSTTKAADIRQLFSTYGKVARAKIFTSKKEPGKTFGLLTMGDAELVDKCVAAMNGKEWNGTVITVEKGNQSNVTAAKTTVAASTAVKKPEPTPTPVVKAEKPGIRKAEPIRKDSETSKSGKVNEAKKEKPSTAREKDRRPVDRIAPSSQKIRREPIRSARHDSRRTITAARSVASRSSGPSRSANFRAPVSMAGRLSRPGHPSTARRPDSYSTAGSRERRPDNDEVARIREEMRHREAERELERERERLRIERERIEREKLELQVMQQRQQLAALKATMEGSRSGRSDSRHGSQSSHSAISRDKHTSASRESHKEPSRDKFSYARPKADDGRPASYRDRSTRSDERRPHVSSSGDRSRSRHDSRSHHDNNNRHDARQDSRHDAPRHEPRHESRHDTTRHSGSFSGNSRSHTFPSRDTQSNASGQQNYYGSRDSYASASSREFEQPRGATSGSWGQASWAGLPTDNWGVRNGGSGEWSGYHGSTGGTSNSNIRIDYDKYRRQF